MQGADILTGLLCAVTGKSRKTESGKVSSGALLMGVMKKGLEWLVVGVCVSVGNGLGVTSVCGAAMTGVFSRTRTAWSVSSSGSPGPTETA